MRLILVTGPWSSGTSAVAGMLDALGIDGRGPFFRTNDKRTPNSFESTAFRDVIDSVASDATLQLTAGHQEVVAAIQKFRETIQPAVPDGVLPECFFLKYPLSALAIPHIARVFDTRVVHVLRPLRQIESTRQRRGWGENFGAKGAQVIYSKMFQALIELPIPSMIVRYPDLLKNPQPFARALAEFSGMKNLAQDRITSAAATVQKDRDA